MAKPWQGAGFCTQLHAKCHLSWVRWGGTRSMELPAGSEHQQSHQHRRPTAL